MEVRRHEENFCMQRLHIFSQNKDLEKMSEEVIIGGSLI